MKKSENKAVVATTVEVPANAVNVNDIEVKLPLGRPANPESASFKKKAAIAAKKAAGEDVKRGRPSNPGSERQAKLAAMAVKAASGAEIKRGRPSDPKSTRQQILIKRNERLEQLRTEAIAMKTAKQTA